MKHFSEKPKRGEAVSWAEGLYASVGENARMAERALDENLQKLRPPVKEEVQRLARITVFSDGYVELDK